MVGSRAQLLLNERFQLAEHAFAELVIWRVPEPLRGSEHWFKYRLALIESGACTVRYDNESGKGDHKHLQEQEVLYAFVDLETLQSDFWSDVEERLRR